MSVSVVFKKISIISMVVLSILSCESDTVQPSVGCTPITTASTFIELQYPLGGESFKIGSTITALWKVNKNKMTSVVIQVSVDGGKNWKDVVEKGIATTQSQNDFSCMEYAWKIGSEFQTVSYKTAEITKILFRVMKYGDSDVTAVSTEITINP